MQVLVCKHTEMSYRTQTHAPEYAGWENEKGLARTTGRLWLSAAGL